MPSIRVECEHCGARLVLKDASRLGSRVRCTNCGEVFIATGTDSEATVEDAIASSGARSRPKSTKGNKRSGGKKSSGSPWVPPLSAVGVIIIAGSAAWLTLGARQPPPPAANSAPASLTKAPVAGTPAAAALTVPMVPTGPAAPAVVPVLPRALKALPAWIVADAPFDVAEFWVTLPPEQNAASAYLDALYEFSPELEACFSESVRAERTATVAARLERNRDLRRAMAANPTSDHGAARVQVVADYATAFRKLEQAQLLPACVFEIGWDVPSLSALFPGVVEAIRAAQLRTAVDLAEGNLDRVITLASSMLRLSRDLRVRTPMSFQDLATATERMTSTFVIIPLLQSPQITAAQCRQLLDVLDRHETSLGEQNRFVTGLQGDYLWMQMLLHDVEQRAGEYEELRWPTAFGGQNATRGEALESSLNAWPKPGDPPQPRRMHLVFEPLMTGMKATDFETSRAWVKERYQQLASGANSPYSERMTTEKQLSTSISAAMAELTAGLDREAAKAGPVLEERIKAKLGEGTLRVPLLAMIIQGKLDADTLSEGNTPSSRDVVSRTSRAGIKALVALRHWYVAHADPPPDLQAVCTEAGLASVPTDGFVDAPLRLATFPSETVLERRIGAKPKVLGGETVIYSVGGDGVDDKALKDATGYVSESGDFLFRLERTPDSLRAHAMSPTGK